MLKRNLQPAHPGEILKEMFIKERNLTITEVAKGLNVARTNLSAIINGHNGISPELAIKLSEAFGNTAQFCRVMDKMHYGVIKPDMILQQIAEPRILKSSRIFLNVLFPKQ